MAFTRYAAPLGLAALLVGCAARHAPVRTRGGEATIIEQTSRDNLTFQYRVCDAPQDIAKGLLRGEQPAAEPSCDASPYVVEFTMVGGSPSVFFTPNKRYSSDSLMGHMIGDKTICNLPNGLCVYGRGSPQAERLRQEFRRVVSASRQEERLFYRDHAGNGVSVVPGKVLHEQYRSATPISGSRP